jgi:hypothetical protein
MHWWHHYSINSTWLVNSYCLWIWLLTISRSPLWFFYSPIKWFWYDIHFFYARAMNLRLLLLFLLLAWCSISPFQHQKKNNWECRKMCLISGNSCCGACEIQLPFRLRLSIPYEVGYSTLDRFTVGIRMNKEIRNRIAVVLKHCLGADDWVFKL